MPTPNARIVHTTQHTALHLFDRSNPLQIRYLEMFVLLAREAGARGLVLMLACHRITSDAWPGKGLWYAKPSQVKSIQQHANPTHRDRDAIRASAAPRTR